MSDGKTNAMRMLDRERVPYEVAQYAPDIRSAAGVAEVLGVDPAHVFKTLVMIADSGSPVLCMVAGDREVDLRRLAAALGKKSLRMATKAEAERLTGLQTGGIGALALRHKRFGVYLDDSALHQQSILVNAGRRGCSVRLAVADLLRLTGATPVALDAPHH